MSKIRVILKPGEPAKITVVGVPGAACHTVSQSYEKALGAVLTTKPTAEAQLVPGTVSQQINLGQS